MHADLPAKTFRQPGSQFSTDIQPEIHPVPEAAFRQDKIDPCFKIRIRSGRVLDLTQREFELLRFLAKTPGKVVSRQELMQEVWQYDYYGDLRAVDVAVRRLREKLETNPAAPEYVMTRRGVGYSLAE